MSPTGRGHVKVIKTSEMVLECLPIYGTFSPARSASDSSSCMPPSPHGKRYVEAERRLFIDLRLRKKKNKEIKEIHLSWSIKWMERTWKTYSQASFHARFSTTTSLGPQGQVLGLNPIENLLAFRSYRLYEQTFAPKAPTTPSLPHPRGS